VREWFHSSPRPVLTQHPLQKLVCSETQQTSHFHIKLHIEKQTEPTPPKMITEWALFCIIHDWGGEHCACLMRLTLLECLSSSFIWKIQIKTIHCILGSMFMGGGMIWAQSQLKDLWKHCWVPREPSWTAAKRSGGGERGTIQCWWVTFPLFRGGSEKHDLNCHRYYCALSTGTNEPRVWMKSSWNIHKASLQLGLGQHLILAGQEKHCLNC
jgi:hypothetical protein